MKFNFLRFAPKVFVVWLLIAAQACTSDPPEPVIPQGSAGYFVVNEGGFGNSNTSISFFDRSTSKMTNDIFEAVNGRALGDQAQSMTVYELNGYIAVQNSAKVEVINAETFKSVATISQGIESPRYFLGVSATKGYVSDWGDGFSGSVKVVDLTSFKVTDTIPTGSGANRMLLKDGKVYVTNNGGYGVDNKVSIIDTSTDAVTGTIELNDNPSTMAFDKDGNLWIAGTGDVFGEEPTNPWIAKVGTDNKVVFTKELPEIVYASSTIAMNKAGDKFYYNYNGSVYAMATSATDLPSAALITKDFYGLAVDPITDEIIGTEAISFSDAGKVYIYNSTGALQTSYDVGIAPSGIAFK